MEGYHKSVLLREVIEILYPTRQNQDGLVSAGRKAWYLDCTLGDGGHSLEFLKRGAKVVGLDVDQEALARAGERIKQAGFEKNFVAIQGNFRDIKNIIAQTEMKDQKFAGAIFDLGVSSLQLETPERGFSFAKNGPLDMRMDQNLAIKALDLVNNLSRKELYAIFKTLGEEKYSGSLADAVVSARQIKPIRTTLDLAEIAKRVVRRRENIHPATRIFQALRIVVNDELNALKEGLTEVKDLTSKNGHIAVISFHSLEDRIVKNIFKDWQSLMIGQIVTKKPIVPSKEEISINPRARSAKLRIFKYG